MASKGGSGLSLKRVGQAIVQSVRDFGHDNGQIWSAALAYNAVLSIFPLLLAAASIASFFVDPAWVVEQITRLVGSFLPQGGGQIRDAVDGAMQLRGQATIFSAIALLWSGSRVFGVAAQALNVAYSVDEDYPFLKRVLLQLVMTITIGLLLLIALIAPTAINFAWQFVSFLPQQANVLRQVVILLIPALLLFLTFYLVYRYVPRREVQAKPALIGALFATILFALARPIFVYGILRLSNYNLVYGSLTAIIILIIFIYYAATITLLGGELSAHLEAIVVEGEHPKELEARHLDQAPLKSREQMKDSGR